MCNIRGWLTAINNVNTLTDPLGGQDLFAFKINYNTIDNGQAGVQKLYNGNIAETHWRTTKDNVTRSYGYIYDNLNRLTDAKFVRPTNSLFTNPNPADVKDTFNESMTYDKNGNIKSLQRNGGLESQTGFDVIDNLNYTYNTNSPNQLLKVDDSTNNTDGFSDGTNTNDDYDYDANGNMVKDDNKSIQKIVYNHLNLPTQIIFQKGGDFPSISYLYTATGKKVSKTITPATRGTTPYTVDYLGGYQYEKGVLLFFPTAEGYVKNTLVNNANSYDYVFNYTDHLGNIRLSYGINPSTGSLTTFEESNYYPFGLKHATYNYALRQIESVKEVEILQEADAEAGLEQIAVEVFDKKALMIDRLKLELNSVYNYKYNGKEYQDELGLNVYDYGARNYDPALGRFANMDDHSENHFASSPYNYCYNNPLVFVDPDGKDGVVTGTGTKDDPYIVKANYYYYGLDKDQIAGVNGAISQYNNGGKAFSFKNGDSEVFVQFNLSATEVTDADTANERANADTIDVGDKSIRFGNTINSGTVEGANHLGEAGRKEVTLDKQKTEAMHNNAPGVGLSKIYQGTMIHEIGHNLGGNHNDPGSIMNYTYANERATAGCIGGNCGSGVYDYSMSSVNSNGVRAIMGRMGQTTEVQSNNGPRMSTYGITNSIYLSKKENSKVTDGSVGRLTLIQNR